MRVQLLGPVEAFSDEGEILPIGGPKQRTVLALLCVEPGRAVSLDHLVEAVWGEHVPERAARSLATFVSNLRRVLGDVVSGGHGAYRTTMGRACVDVCVFEDRFREAEAIESHDPESARHIYREAIGVWVGRPFEGIDAHGLLMADITRLEDLRLLALERVLALDIEAGDHRVALIELENLVVENPYRDDLCSLYMRALYRSGRQADALEAFRTHRDRLAEDLGLDPSPELEALELSILTHDDGLTASEPTGTVEVDVPALPRRYSSFVGREAEVDMVLDRLEGRRMVSLVGPAGIGKTSVALEVAHALVERGAGPVVWARLERAEDVGDALARAIGLNPAPTVDPLDVVVGFLSSHPHVLVVDECEVHVEDVAVLTDGILSSTQSRVLATSREPIGLAGESIVRIGGLTVEGAVDLFCQRADLDTDPGDPALTKVRALCEALDGIPLAVELLAARARSIPLDRLADRIDSQISLLRRRRSLDDRHGSLSAALDWSHDLLSSNEKAVLRAVSMYRTPFTVADAEAVSDSRDVDETLDRLVETSLLEPSTSGCGFRFLEPIRQYAAYHLASSGDADAVGRRYAAWMADEADRAIHDVMGPQVDTVTAWLFDRRNEMLSAIDWALDHDDPDIATRIVAALGRYMVGTGLHAPWTARSLSALDHPLVSHDRSWVVAAVATVGMFIAEERHEEGSELLERARVVARSIDDDYAVWAVDRSSLWFIDGRRNGEAKLAAVDELMSNPHGGDFDVETLWYTRAIVLVYLARMDEALETVQEHRRRWAERSDVPSAIYLAVTSSVAAYRGDLESALRLANEAAEWAEEHRVYRSAIGLWERVGAFADRIGDRSALTTAVERHRYIESITGAERSIVLEIRSASWRGNHDEVLSLAREWFGAPLGDPLVEDESQVVDRDLTIFGSVTEPPCIFTILLPVASALEALGRVRESSVIAGSVPALMAASRFAFWDQFRELDRWEPLRSRLGRVDDEPLTLPGVYETVCAMVGDLGDRAHA